MRRHVLSAALGVCLCMAAAGLTQGGGRDLGRCEAGGPPKYTQPPSLHARRISKRETDLALKGAYWLLFTIPSPTPGSQDAGSRRWLLLTLVDQGNTRQVHPQRLSASKSGDEVVQKAGIAGPFLLSLTLAQSLVSRGPPAMKLSLGARHDDSRLPGSWEGG